METINIPKEEYEELLRKAQQLSELQNKKTEIEEVNEDDFDNIEVKPKYLEKLERIKKEG